LPIVMTATMFTGASRMGIALVLSALVGVEARAQARRLDLAALLDAYAEGRFDEALAPIRQAPRDRARELRQQIVLTGNQWVDAVAADRSRRALAAAAFALEVERIRAERGEWPADDDEDCAGRCVIEWACSLLSRRGAADEGERIWMLASIALAGGVRDWTFLQTPLSPPSERSGERGHVHHALARVPDEPRFRLARAVALASRFAVTSERDTFGAGTRTEPVPSSLVNIVVAPGAIVSPVERRRTTPLEYVKQQFGALVSDPSVGDEARIRAAYVYWVRGEEHAALAVGEVADRTKDPDLKYVAHFLAGQAAQVLGDPVAAETHYTAALDARPHSQSATLALSTLYYLRGEARQAYDLVAASRSGRPRDDDPWRMLLYGDFTRLPMLVAELRRQVRP
jgi:tetratricopeptide (TPR) repeat protein